MLLTNRGFAAGRASTRDMQLFGRGDSVYLYLPLAHVFGQICQAATLEVGGALAFWGGDANQIIAELGQVHPTVLPSVPRIFEKVYTLAMAFIPPERADAAAAAISLGVRVRDVGVHRRDVHRRGAGGVRSGRRRDVLAGARASSVAASSWRSPAPRRSRPTSCASSTPPASR